MQGLVTTQVYNTMSAHSQLAHQSAGRLATKRYNTLLHIFDQWQCPSLIYVSSYLCLMITVVCGSCYKHAENRIERTFSPLRCAKIENIPFPLEESMPGRAGLSKLTCAYR